MVNVYIKGVDEEAFRAAKILAAKKDRTLGRIVSDALTFFYKEETQKLSLDEFAVFLKGMPKQRIGKIDSDQLHKQELASR